MFVNNDKAYTDIPNTRNFNHILQDLTLWNSAAEISMIKYTFPS